MTAQACDEMQLLVQAELDGELPVAEVARLHAHLAACPACTVVRQDLEKLSRSVRGAAPRHRAPDQLREMLARSTAVQAVQRPRQRGWAGRAVSFGAGAAIAAGLALALLPIQPDPQSDPVVANEVVAAHIRALQPGHLIDVVSTDRHTVKPWFDGRLPFAPPVKDLAPDGFPLAGGRLDYMHGHLAAGLVYRAGPHVINLFSWPSGSASGHRAGSSDGYNFICWHEAGMTFWAVSDLNPAELATFESRWRAS